MTYNNEPNLHIARFTGNGNPAETAVDAFSNLQHLYNFDVIVHDLPSAGGNSKDADPYQQHRNVRSSVRQIFANNRHMDGLVIVGQTNHTLEDELRGKPSLIRSAVNYLQPSPEAEPVSIRDYTPMAMSERSDAGILPATIKDIQGVNSYNPEEGIRGSLGYTHANTVMAGLHEALILSEDTPTRVGALVISKVTESSPLAQSNRDPVQANQEAAVGALLSIGHYVSFNR